LEVRKIDIPNRNSFEKIINASQLLIYIRKPWFFTRKELDIYRDIDIFFSPVTSSYPHFFIDKPFIFTLHDMQERYYPEFFRLYDRIIRWLNNRALAKKADKMICE